MRILVLNPGGNSLKAEIVLCQADQRYAFEGAERISVSIEGIGRNAKFLRYADKSVVSSEPVEAASWQAAVERIFDWIDRNAADADLKIDRVGLRVVHGGPNLTDPTEITDQVASEIASLEKLAPLHNQSSLEVLEAIRRRLPGIPVVGVFDSAFHRTIPEEAALYAIPPELSRKHHIRRYGFHGISHRYLLERYAHLRHKRPGECTLITMHLESGCSLCAIRNGQSVDNTMGLTPLEGLMMGTRSGDVDPSLIPYLVREEGLDLDAVMELLNKRSGLLAVSGQSLDTRVLMKMYDSNPQAKLAIDMFCYRILKAAGAYLSVLGGVEAIIFGGGIGKNGVFLRRYIGEHLDWCGVAIDPAENERLIDAEGRISTDSTTIQAWVIVTREGLQIAHECCRCSLEAV